jgi:hypothetical protein
MDTVDPASSDEPQQVFEAVPLQPTTRRRLAIIVFIVLSNMVQVRLSTAVPNASY